MFVNRPVEALVPSYDLSSVYNVRLQSLICPRLRLPEVKECMARGRKIGLAPEGRGNNGL